MFSTSEDVDRNKTYVIRAESSSFVIVDSQDRATNADNTAFLSSPSNFLIGVPTSARNIYRIGLTGTQFFWDIPNINARNNTFQIFGGLGNFTITIPEALYTTTATLFTAMQTALNAQAVPYAPWTVAANTQGAITITSTNGPWNLRTGGSLTNRANPRQFLVMGLNNVDSPAVGPFTVSLFIPSLVYTRHFDITSNAITKFAKSDSTTRGRPANLVDRVYTGKFSLTREYQNVDFTYIKKLRYAPLANIAQIDIRLIDEFSDDLYIPSYSSFSIELILLTINYQNE